MRRSEWPLQQKLETKRHEKASRVEGGAPELIRLEASLAGLRQCKVRYIARDLAPWVPPEVVYGVLLRRGVFKWFAVRKGLIRLKNDWRDEIRILHAQLRHERDPVRRAELRGRLHALEEARAAVRALCHMPRAVAPDGDRDAKRFLEAASRAGVWPGSVVAVKTSPNRWLGTVVGARNGKVAVQFLDADGRPAYRLWYRPDELEVAA